jgi:hypothetical protein
MFVVANVDFVEVALICVRIVLQRVVYPHVSGVLEFTRIIIKVYTAAMSIYIRSLARKSVGEF